MENITLEESLVAVIQDATGTLSEAKQFVLAETPEVVTQLLTWHMVYYSLLFAFSVCSLGLIFYILKKANDINTGSYDFDEAKQFGFRVTAFCIAFASGSAFNVKWLQILIAPKLYLIEYAAELVK